eukprot:749616-Hanusia_phi.AAC.1
MSQSRIISWPTVATEDSNRTRPSCPGVGPTQSVTVPTELGITQAGFRLVSPTQRLAASLRLSDRLGRAAGVSAASAVRSDTD